MSGFTENALIRKLQELNSSQQSIQTLSLWLIHHRKHHAVIVKTWFKEILKGNLEFLFFSSHLRFLRSNNLDALFFAYKRFILRNYIEFRASYPGQLSRIYLF